jgi:hypothetical protein
MVQSIDPEKGIEVGLGTTQGFAILPELCQPDQAVLLLWVELFD